MIPMNRNILPKIACIRLFVFFASLVYLSGCKKEESNEYKNLFIDSVNVINMNDPEDAIARISFLQDYPLHNWGIEWMIPNLMSGEYSDNEIEYNEFSAFILTPTTSFLDILWTYRYKSIQLCNLFLEKTKDIDNAEMNRYKGKVHFYRAFAYYNLIRNFGNFYPEKDMSSAGVPIISNDQSQAVRASSQEVYNYIIADLDSAYDLLPDPGYEVYLNKYAALAVAAKTHIWFQQYNKAELELNEIIQSNQFSLLTNFADNFNGSNENGPESIYELQFYENGSSYYYYGAQLSSRFSLYISVSPRRFSVSTEIVNKFGSDKRAHDTFYSMGDVMYNYGSETVNNDGINYVKKYAHIEAMYSYLLDGVNIPLIRLADLYLLYSETQILKSNLSEAIQYINAVRQRSGNSLIDLGGKTADQMMDILRKERFYELCGEGEYWYDLIRWDQAEQELSNRGFLRGTHENFPIPEDVIENNPGITQN
jgi:starch-binding outer membrane protein, SusD/RagB family